MLAPIAVQSYNNFERSTGVDGDLVIAANTEHSITAGITHNFNSITIGQGGTLRILGDFDVPTKITKLLVRGAITFLGTGGYISLAGGFWKADNSVISDYDKYGNKFLASIGVQVSGGQGARITTPTTYSAQVDGNGGGGGEFVQSVGNRNPPAATSTKGGGVNGGFPAGANGDAGGGGARGLHGVPVVISCHKVIGTYLIKNSTVDLKGGNGGNSCTANNGNGVGYGCYPLENNVALWVGGAGGAGGNAADVYFIQYEGSGASDYTFSYVGGNGGNGGTNHSSFASYISTGGAYGEDGTHLQIKPTGAPTNRTVHL